MGSGTSADLLLSEALPIEAHLGAIVSALGPGETLLLQAPPGAGKTTRVPLALLAGLDRSERLLLLEPRRLATRAAAQRLAHGLGEPLGQTVGYSVRLESRTSAATRLEVVTTGLFLRRLQADPALEGIGCVIFDEFHERSAEADLGLALVRQARELLRPDLRLLVMSATLDLEPLAEGLDGARVISCQGRSHPVQVHHQPPREGERLEQQVVRCLEHFWPQDQGGSHTALVFLPGRREIRRVEAAITATSWGQEIDCTPLHGDLPLAAQARAIAAPRHGVGKVVLATSIAESSLTIEAVRLVIDSGLSRRSRFDPASGMDRLQTLTASLASAEQRRGRAGRLGPGVCVRLWTASSHRRRPRFDPAGIEEADPLPIALQLAAWGSPHGDDLPWLIPPPRSSLEPARSLLHQLGALDAVGQITPHGRAMASLGVHPRLAHMLLRAEAEQLLPLGCSLAVLLSERDPLPLQEVGCDLLRRLEWLETGGGATGPRRGLLRLRQRLGRQVRSCLPEPAPADDRGLPAAGTASQQEQAALLLGWAYPERLALRRGSAGGFLLRGGRGARLPACDPLAHERSLAIARLDGEGAEARVLLAVRLPQEVLERLAAGEAHWSERIRWDPEAERVRAERHLRLGALVLRREPSAAPDPEAVRTAMAEGLERMGMEALPWTPSSRRLQQRLALAHALLGPPWPDRSPAALGGDPLGWLGDHLADRRSRRDLQDIDLVEALWGDLPWPLRGELASLLPERVRLPSGRTVPVDYSSDPPVLAVKLQEMFGLEEAPRLLGGRLPLSLHLLSPAGRPVAITRDLAGFWKEAYAGVRKELRGRYPKHPWPEDPLRAEPTSLTKAALGRRRIPQGR